MIVFFTNARSPGGSWRALGGIPSREDLEAIRRFEDFFGCPGNMADLLRQRLHDQRVPADALASSWDIDADRLRRWMTWYGIAELAQPAARKRQRGQGKSGRRQPTPPAPPKPGSQVRLTTSALGTIIQAIANAWQKTKLWDNVAEAVNAPVDELREWMLAHLEQLSQTLIPSVELNGFLHPSAPQPAEPSADQPNNLPDPVNTDCDVLTRDQRPPGIILSRDAERMIAAACRAKGCTEPELFAEFDPEKAYATARKLGIGTNVYLLLIQHYSGGTLPVQKEAVAAAEDDL